MIMNKIIKGFNILKFIEFDQILISFDIILGLTIKI